MPNTTKGPKAGGRPAVRQVKGPGMNKGLWKRHKMAAPKPYVDPKKPSKGGKRGKAKSLLPPGAW